MNLGPSPGFSFLQFPKVKTATVPIAAAISPTNANMSLLSWLPIRKWRSMLLGHRTQQLRKYPKVPWVQSIRSLTESDVQFNPQRRCLAIPEEMLEVSPLLSNSVCQYFQVQWSGSRRRS